MLTRPTALTERHLQKMATDNAAPKELKFLNWNCGSIRTQSETLHAEMAEGNYDVVTLQETRVKFPPNINGYQLFYSPGETAKSTRGLVTYVKDGIKAEPAKIPLKLSQQGEYVPVKITTKAGDLYLINMYLAPSLRLGANDFDFDNLDDIEFLVVGDINAHADKKEGVMDMEPGGRASHFFKKVEEHGISWLNPTGETHYAVKNGVRTKTHIEHILCSENLAEDAAVAIHDPVFISSKTKKAPTTPRREFHRMMVTTIRCPMPTERENFVSKPQWDKFDKNKFFSKTEAPFGELLQDEQYKQMSSQEKYNAFKEIVDEGAKDSVPYSKFHSRPWKSWFWDAELKSAKHRLNRANKKLKRCPNQYNTKEYCEAKSELENMVAKKKSAKWKQIFSEIDLSKDPRRGWERVKYLRNAGKRQKRTVHTTQEETNKIGDMFRDRSDPELNLTDEIKEAMQENHDARQEEINQAKERACNKGDKPLDKALLFKHLDKAPRRSAPGNDGISYILLHALGTNGRNALYDVMQSNYEEGKLLPEWKEAEIVPIPKKEPGEFRPISLLVTVSKLLEILVRARIFMVKEISHANLFGFERGRGCTDPLAVLRERVSASINLSKCGRIRKPTKGQPRCLAIYWDFEKAFELANKEIILHQLVKKGVAGKLLIWIEDYLSGRTGYVKNGIFKSPKFELKAGTPQGSVLSPTLFNLLVEYILEQSDLQKSENCPAPTRLAASTFLGSYADDLVTIISLPSEQVIAEAQKVVSFFERQANLLGLKINVSKTKVQLFGDNYAKRAEEPLLDIKTGTLTVYGQPIEKVETFEYLGIKIDSDGKFTEHTKDTVKTLKKTVGLVSFMTSGDASDDTPTKKGQSLKNSVGVSTKVALTYARGKGGGKLNYGAPILLDTHYDRFKQEIFSRGQSFASTSMVENSTRELDSTYSRLIKRALGIRDRTPHEIAHIESGVPPLVVTKRNLAEAWAIKVINSHQPHPMDEYLVPDEPAYGVAQPINYRRNGQRGTHRNTYSIGLNTELDKLGVMRRDKNRTATDRMETMQAKFYQEKSWKGRKDSNDPDLLLFLTNEYIHENTDENTLCVFTDGSVNQQDNTAGSAAVIYFKNKEISTAQVAVGNNPSSTTTELVAVLIGLRKAATVPQAVIEATTKIAVFTDSTGTIKKLSADPVERTDDISLIAEICRAARQLPIPLEFHWIPSHVGVQGNERADSLAKNAVDNEQLLRYADSIGTSTSRSRKKNMATFLEHVAERFSTNRSKNLQIRWYFQVNPDLKPFNIPNGLSRQEELILTRARTDDWARCPFEHHRNCVWCGGTFNSYHVFTQCRKSIGLRKKY